MAVLAAEAAWAGVTGQSPPVEEEVAAPDGDDEPAEEPAVEAETAAVAGSSAGRRRVGRGRAAARTGGFRRRRPGASADVIRQYELVERVKSYEPSADEALLNRAYVFSMKAHGTQTRASGDPYFAHPIEVAGILTQLKLDSTSIATALLHDTVEDTVATIEEINDLFGEETARLVDGVTKLSRLDLQSDQAHQAENLRKFLLALSEDIRVLLVKLADRLHNMRTLHYVPSDKKRQRIARETMEIYAPLAERIGLQAFKAELEDLAFKELNPDGFHTMETRLKALRDQAGGMVERVTESLTETLRSKRLRATVTGREKRPYSIWQKMQRKKLAFEQLTDIVGFRVVTEDEEECYRALGIVHRAYPMVPGRFKDYISTPKPNGYRSLHTAVLGPEQRRIEIQIRTRDMHEEAEYGVAAHWLFKQAGDVHDDRQQRLAAPAVGNPRQGLGAGGAARARQARDVSGRGVLLFAPGSADHAPAWGDAGGFRLCGAH